MDTKMISYLKGTMESTDYAIARLVKGELKSKDRYMLGNIIGEIQENLKNELVNDNLKEINCGLTIIQNIVLDPNEKPAGSDLRDAVTRINRALKDEEKANYLAEAFQLDVQSIIPLMEQLREKQEEVRQVFQKAVDIDRSIHGNLSELTLKSLEAFNYDVNKNGEVIAQSVIEKNGDNKTYKSARKYLELPPLGKKQFKELTEYLKSNGARFDAPAKSWYITDKCSIEKFEPYLKRESIRGRLEKKKERIKEEKLENKESKIERGRE